MSESSHWRAWYRLLYGRVGMAASCHVRLGEVANVAIGSATNALLNVVLAHVAHSTFEPLLRSWVTSKVYGADQVVQVLLSALPVCACEDWRSQVVDAAETALPPHQVTIVAERLIQSVHPDAIELCATLGLDPGTDGSASELDTRRLMALTLAVRATWEHVLQHVRTWCEASRAESTGVLVQPDHAVQALCDWISVQTLALCASRARLLDVMVPPAYEITPHAWDVVPMTPPWWERAQGRQAVVRAWWAGLGADLLGLNPFPLLRARFLGCYGEVRNLGHSVGSFMASASDPFRSYEAELTDGAGTRHLLWFELSNGCADANTGPFGRVYSEEGVWVLLFGSHGGDGSAYVRSTGLARSRYVAHTFPLHGLLPDGTTRGDTVYHTGHHVELFVLAVASAMLQRVYVDFMETATPSSLQRHAIRGTLKVIQCRIASEQHLPVLPPPIWDLIGSFIEAELPPYSIILEEGVIGHNLGDPVALRQFMQEAVMMELGVDGDHDVWPEGSEYVSHRPMPEIKDLDDDANMGYPAQLLTQSMYRHILDDDGF